MPRLSNIEPLNYLNSSNAHDNTKNNSRATYIIVQMKSCCISISSYL